MTTKMSVGQQIGQLADEQGWSGYGLGDLAWAFIMNSELAEDFLHFLRGVAEEENSA